MSRRSSAGHWLAALGTAWACDRAEPPAPSNISSEFGIFYGGQVQERQELPLELDRTRQLQGFRLQRSPPPATPLEIRWELGKPGAGLEVAGRRGLEARRRVQRGQAEWRPGEAVFEQMLPFSPGDRSGLWNIRVLSRDRALLDRPFLVFDPAQRERALRALEERDGG